MQEYSEQLLVNIVHMPYDHLIYPYKNLSVYIDFSIIGRAQSQWHQE